MSNYNDFILLMTYPTDQKLLLLMHHCDHHTSTYRPVKSTEVSSVLSEADTSTEQPEGEGSLDDSLSLGEKWERNEALYKQRDQLLRRIKERKVGTFIQAIERRERDVRRQERTDLLYRHLNRSNISVSYTNVDPDWHDAQNDDYGCWKGAISYPKESFSSIHRWCSTILHRSLPGAFSLVLYCLAHSAIYEVISYALSELKKPLQGSLFAELSLYFVVLLLGISLVRATGYLDWWLNEIDCEAVEFDDHNRRLLGITDVSDVVKRYPKVMAMTFVFGYHLVYNATLFFYYKLTAVLDQRLILLRDLPSRIDSATSLIEKELNSLPAKCQLMVDRIEQEYLLTRQADMQHTWRILSSFSYDAYWSETIHAETDPSFVPSSALFTASQGMLLSLVTAMTAISLLHFYGLPFWDRYL